MINFEKINEMVRHNLMWGDLRSIFVIVENKKLPFQYEHLDAKDEVIIEKDLEIKQKR